ncbi:snRNA-activating protein complex subunit 3 [Engraulis encrasicolus]|uniref:snRNA-activating protein complex subunit 3 n=1 Tax=Engraulis encrasicolus TaxID=184585 RepID=UPI002FD1E16A
MAEGTTTDDENIPRYEPNNLNSQVIHIESFRKLWLEALPPDLYSYDTNPEEVEDAKLAELLELPVETLNELKHVCSVDSLKSHPDDSTVDQNLVPPDPKLACLRLRKRRQDYRETLSRDTLGRHELYFNEMESSHKGMLPEDPDTVIPEGELILSFNVIYPVIFERFKHVRAHQTLQVFGSQKLTELRDALCCVTDLQVFGEFSNIPDATPQHISKDHFKSAFFFFEGVFYNDMRYPECQDLSETIRDWAKTHGFPEYTTEKMEDTTFNQLRMRIGYPYYYCHQGDCEHLMILTDMRLIHPDDCRDRSRYPLLTHKHRVLTRKCCVCHLYISRWITTKDRLAPMDPCLFCDKCFRMFHYDTKGNKLYDFEAYVYVDPGVFN